MNRKLSIRPDQDNERQGATQTWQMEDRVNLFLSDFDPVHNVNLRGHDVFCLYTVGISPPYCARIPIQKIKNLNEFIGVLQEVDKLTNFECNTLHIQKKELAKNRKKKR